MNMYTGVKMWFFLKSYDVNLILFSISQDIDVYDTMFILNWSKEGNDKIRSNIHGKPKSYL